MRVNNLNSLLRPFVDEMLLLHPKNGGIPMAARLVLMILGSATIGIAVTEGRRSRLLPRRHRHHHPQL